ncbi:MULTISPECIES: hypothetical protein [Streptomyces]|uniref:Cytochrome C oxidase subunit I n=1 Tax=Streptomyces lycii TaxID=2654337 RepID=A0ABQ7FE92_9ACTN|nr:hypothetical protein [Streptomyces lycii]KAF4406625.1 hypothetical protein GCU69_23980 [Streptomyces lycii]
MTPDEHEVTAGLRQLEGYLRCRTDIAEAEREAAAFADRMPWLTDGGREELVRLYTEDRLELTRRGLEQIVARSAELRQEYAARYAELRGRLVRITTAALLCAAALSGCSVILAHTGR